MDIFIRLDGITGESKDAKHNGWIDVLTISYDVSQSSSMNVGGGGGVGRADFTPVTFGHHVDRASPALFKYCASGKHIPKWKYRRARRAAARRKPCGSPWQTCWWSTWRRAARRGRCGRSR